MARIPEQEVQRLKEEISVQRLIEDAGVVLKKSGKDFVGRCPLHADDTASLVVTPAKNLWHCFGCLVVWPWPIGPSSQRQNSRTALARRASG